MMQFYATIHGCPPHHPGVAFPPGWREQVATRLIFFVAGFSVGAWAPLVPFAKGRLNLDDGTLGLLLLCLGTGSIVTMPLAGLLAGRFGCRRVITVASMLVCLTLPLLAVASQWITLALVLAVFGAAVGSMDCAVNIQAIVVERASGRPMMSGFHGLFSVGGIVGAGGVSALLSLGVANFTSVLVAAAVVAVTFVIATPGLLPYGTDQKGAAFVVPHGIVLFIGALCFIVFLAEGAVLDWSAVFLTSLRGMTPTHAGLGYTCFSLAMTAGRLTGDAVVRRLGTEKILVVGGCVAAVSLLLVALVPGWWSGLGGFLLLGVGCANIVPVLFTATGRQKVVPENVAVPAVTTLGYTGSLVGPAAVGFVSRASNLPVAFVVVALLLFGVAVSGYVLARKGLA